MTRNWKRDWLVRLPLTDRDSSFVDSWKNVVRASCDLSEHQALLMALLQVKIFLLENSTDEKELACLNCLIAKMEARLDNLREIPRLISTSLQNA